MQLFIHSSHVSQSKLNISYANQSQARNMAMSGMQIGLKEVSGNFGWRPDPEPWTITISGNTVDVFVDDFASHPDLEPQQIRVRAESTLEGVSGNAHAILEVDNILPEIPASLGFYTDQTQLNINGNAFIFSGEDTNPDGTAGTKEDLPGVAADTSAYDNLLDNLNSQQIGTIEDSGYEEKALNNVDLHERVDGYISVSEVFNESSVSPLGDYNYPKIVRMNGSGGARDETGAGIFIIPEGSTFTAKGDFTFYGLIIVQGKLDLRGNVTVYGSVLFGGQSELEIPDEDEEASFSGHVKTIYSSSSLSNANNKLAHFLDTGVTVTEIFD
ncbi:MAG: hypothetical protein WD098_09725 [Balneolales bacterium]